MPGLGRPHHSRRSCGSSRCLSNDGAGSLIVRDPQYPREAAAMMASRGCAGNGRRTSACPRSTAGYGESSVNAGVPPDGTEDNDTAALGRSPSAQLRMFDKNRHSADVLPIGSGAEICMFTKSQRKPHGTMGVLARLRVRRAAMRAAAAALLERSRPFLDLLLPANHSAAAIRERNTLVTRRVRLVAAVFAVLTLAWIPIDAVTIPWPYWGDIMIGRVAVALAFFALALRPGHWPRLGAAFEVTLLIAPPLGFFLYTNDVLSVSGYHGALAISAAYFQLPLVIAAGLSIFPLTALEALLPAALAIAAMAVSVQVWPQFLGGQSGLTTVWRIILIGGTAGLAGMSRSISCCA